jgi:hypothetical protein
MALAQQHSRRNHEAVDRLIDLTRIEPSMPATDGRGYL